MRTRITFKIGHGTVVEVFAIAILDTFINCEFPSPSILAYMTAIRNFMAA